MISVISNIMKKEVLSEFASFLDIDGEEVSVHLSNLVLVEFSTSVLDEGFRELNKDLKE